jgi:hypothetical protein
MTDTHHDFRTLSFSGYSSMKAALFAPHSTFSQEISAMCGVLFGAPASGSIGVEACKKIESFLHSRDRIVTTSQIKVVLIL